MSLYSRVPLAFLTSFIDGLLSPVAFPNRHLKLLKEVNMPEGNKAAARASFERTKKLDYQVQKVKLSAWRKMIKVCKNLPREADYLPDEYSDYDNEISINGDSLVPHPLEKTQETINACYYLKNNSKLDGRDVEARYVWLGQRNRGSKLTYRLGPVAVLNDTEYWGDINVSPENPGVLVRRMGEHYELFAYKPFLKYFIIRTRYGVKIGNAITYGIDRCMLVTIPFSIKRR